MLALALLYDTAKIDPRRIQGQTIFLFSLVPPHDPDVRSESSDWAFRFPSHVDCQSSGVSTALLSCWRKQRRSRLSTDFVVPGKHNHVSMFFFTRHPNFGISLYSFVTNHD